MSLRQNRSSNFELLRILAMVMIVIYHITCHTIQPQLTDAGSIAALGNGLFNHPVFYKRLLILSTIYPFGKIGDTVFLLISGYFLASKEEIDLERISKKLLYPLAFVATVLVVGPFILHVIFPNTYINLMSITNVNTQSWFIGYYFVVIIIAALFLNKILRKFERKQYLTFLLVLFALISFGWSGSLLNSIAETLRVLVAGVFVFSLGGYIKLYDPFKRIRSYVIILIWIGVYALIYLSYYNTVHMAIEAYTLSNSTDDFIQVLLTSFSDFSMVIIILGVSAFELVKRIRIPNSRVINYLGSAAFTVYLLHDNAFFYSIWNRQDWITLLYNDPLVFILKLLLWGIAIYALGVIVHTVFIGFGKLCRRMRGLVVKSEDEIVEKL